MLDVDFLGATLLVLILESPCTIVGRYIASISSNISCQQDHHNKRKANELQNILISVLQAEKGRECHKLPSLVNLSQHMLNRVGKEEFEKLSDVPEWSVFDLSDALFDKFLLFFKLEAEMRPEERKERREKGLGKATALAERGGKAGEGDERKTLEEKSDLEASFAEEAEVKCNADQVVEKLSFPLFHSLKMENRWRRNCALFPPALRLDFTCVPAATVPSIADRCTRKSSAKSLQPLAVLDKKVYDLSLEFQ